MEVSESCSWPLGFVFCPLLKLLTIPNSKLFFPANVSRITNAFRPFIVFSRNISSCSSTWLAGEICHFKEIILSSFPRRVKNTKLPFLCSGLIFFFPSPNILFKLSLKRKWSAIQDEVVCCPVFYRLQDLNQYCQLIKNLQKSRGLIPCVALLCLKKSLRKIT